MPERVRALVYLDTLVPEDGQSWMDLLGPTIAEPLRQAAERFGDGWARAAHRRAAAALGAAAVAHGHAAGAC